MRAPPLTSSEPLSLIFSPLLASVSTQASDSGPADETFDSPLHGPPREDSLLGITYHWKHENHDPGSLPDLARQRNCGAVREWIEMQVQQGKSVSEIMRAVRMSLPDLQKVSTLDLRLEPIMTASMLRTLLR